MVVPDVHLGRAQALQDFDENACPSAAREMAIENCLDSSKGAPDDDQSVAVAQVRG